MKRISIVDATEEQINLINNNQNERNSRKIKRQS